MFHNVHTFSFPKQGDVTEDRVASAAKYQTLSDRMQKRNSEGGPDAGDVLLQLAVLAQTGWWFGNLSNFATGLEFADP